MCIVASQPDGFRVSAASSVSLLFTSSLWVAQTFFPANPLGAQGAGAMDSQPVSITSDVIGSLPPVLLTGLDCSLE